MYKAWSYDQNHNSYTGVKEMSAKLPAGLYDLRVDSWNNPHATEKKVKADLLQHFSTGPMSMVLTEINRFWQAKERYQKLGVTHKRGMLLHGPAGCGKTGIVTLVVRRTIAADGLVLQMDDVEDFLSGLPLLRQVEKDRPLLVLIEDIERLCKSGYEEPLLEMMDGTSSLGDGLMFLATTNKLKEVPERIRCRPSRIDLLVEVPVPDAQQREEYLKFVMTHFDGLGSALRASQWASSTQGFSLAQLKEVVLGVFVYEKTPEQAIEQLRPMSPKPETEDETED
jgi:ATPase family protein associated with various cellular activities (AAA)